MFAVLRVSLSLARAPSLPFSVTHTYTMKRTWTGKHAISEPEPLSPEAGTGREPRVGRWQGWCLLLCRLERLSLSLSHSLSLSLFLPLLLSLSLALYLYLYLSHTNCSESGLSRAGAIWLCQLERLSFPLSLSLSLSFSLARSLSLSFSRSLSLSLSLALSLTHIYKH